MKEKVLQFLQTIPKGKVTSYKSLAIRFGTHPRAIASVMRYNKYPELYPCYKVVYDDGKISGYSGGDGIVTKIEKLKKDGIVVRGRRIEKKYFLDL